MLGLGWTPARRAGKLPGVCETSNDGCPSCGASIESGAPHGQGCALRDVCPGCRDGVGCLFVTECRWPEGLERPVRRELPPERRESYEARLARLRLGQLPWAAPERGEGET